MRRWIVGGGAALSLVLAGLYVVVPGSQDNGAGTRMSDLAAKKGCEVTVTSPLLGPGARLALASGDSLNVTLTGRALRCPSALLSVYATVGAGAETLLGTATSSSAGAWSYGPTAITDSATTVLRLEMVLDAGRTTSATVTVVADTNQPKVVITSPAADDWGVLRVVASAPDAGCGSGGNIHADKAEPGWVYDLACAAGGQVSPVVTVTGGAPGTLTASYGDAGLASVAIATSPQTFTSADLGVWTLEDWTRADLVVRADRQPDGGPVGGTATRTLVTRVATTTPPALQAPDGGVGVAVRIVNNRGADFDVSYLLPTVPAGVGSASIHLAWTTSTDRRRADVSRGTYVIASDAGAVAEPATAGRGGLFITNCRQADASLPVYCSTDPAVTPATGTVVAPVYNGTTWTCGYADFSPDAGDWRNSCTGEHDPEPTVYCVTAGDYTSSVTVAEGGLCSPINAAWLEGPNAVRLEQCWMHDTEAVPQVWECADGRTYAPGDVYTGQIRHAPPLNTYWVLGWMTW